MWFPYDLNLLSITFSMKYINLKTDNHLLSNLNNYVDSNIAIINSVKDISESPEVVVLEGYLLIVTREGKARLKVSHRNVELSRGVALVCTPNILLETDEISDDLDIFGCFVETSFAQKSMRELNISYLGILQSYGIAHLSEDDLQALESYHLLLARKLKMERSDLNNRTLYHLIHTTALELYSMFLKDESRFSDIVSEYNSAEQIFRDFLVILRSNDRTVRSVNEVADMLGISSKYFSCICKRITGKTALEIINEEVLNRAKIRLRDPKQNIKQIALELGFSNQSHFGTFIRRMTGQSPIHLRAPKGKESL